MHHVPTKVEAILDNWRSLVRSGWDAEMLQQLLKRLHALVFLTNKFSLNRACRITRSLKLQLETTTLDTERGVPSEVTIRELDALFLAFSVAIHNGSTPQPSVKLLPIQQRKYTRPADTSVKQWLYLLDVNKRTAVPLTSK